ncbi:MAG: hypothetical protein JWM36_4644 [Hyphomicrobiales bacterium]|nr:hypothetical protein [Hyphomicrobiales bacterium]
MKLVVFGLTISSSWGNGHATLWRGLCRSLTAMGWTVVFYERNLPFYAQARDFVDMPGRGALRLYGDWADVEQNAQRDLQDADAAIVTSYCPDGIAATELIVRSPCARRVFYDLDTPVTLDDLEQGRPLSSIGARGLRDFDLVLSFTGGPALEILRDKLGATRVAPLYGHADPDVHRAAPGEARLASSLSYLGTYAADRQAALTELFVEPARRLPGERFLMAGAQYPDDFPWTSNIHFLRHLPPQDHSAFFCSARLSLNVTRASMSAMGWCPSGRLFEAAACGAAQLSDAWPGLCDFFTPGEDLLIAGTAQEALDALALSDIELARIGRNARDNVIARHTSARRAQELVQLLDSVGAPGAILEPAAGA